MKMRKEERIQNLFVRLLKDVDAAFVLLSEMTPRSIFETLESVTTSRRFEETEVPLSEH